MLCISEMFVLVSMAGILIVSCLIVEAHASFHPISFSYHWSQHRWCIGEAQWGIWFPWDWLPLILPPAPVDAATARHSAPSSPPLPPTLPQPLAGGPRSASPCYWRHQGRLQAIALLPTASGGTSHSWEPVSFFHIGSGNGQVPHVQLTDDAEKLFLIHAMVAIC